MPLETLESCTMAGQGKSIWTSIKLTMAKMFSLSECNHVLGAWILKWDLLRKLWCFEVLRLEHWMCMRRALNIDWWIDFPLLDFGSLTAQSQSCPCWWSHDTGVHTAFCSGLRSPQGKETVASLPWKQGKLPSSRCVYTELLQWFCLHKLKLTFSETL